jgi:hypothetical protein
MSYKKKIAGIALTLTLLVGGGGAFAAQSPQYDRITNDISSLRQLELLQPLDIEIQSREQLQEWLIESLDSYPVDEQAQAERVLVIFGFIEPGTNIASLQQDILGEQVAGYYDAETSTMVVVRSDGAQELSANDEVTFAHEVVHALQDQHFGLISVQGDVDLLTDDELLAIKAMIEGDATVAQVLYMIRNPKLLEAVEDELENYDSPMLDAAPLFYSETLMFPYDAGSFFVMDIYQEGGWESVDAMFAAPPTTTEQILHPEKYLAGEEAIPVTVPELLPVLGDEWTEIDDNSMGEFIIDVFLRNGGARNRVAREASEGWGGDAYVVVGNEDETAFVWNTAWDTDEDAVEFFEALAATEGERLAANPETVSGDDHIRLAGSGYVGEIVLDGDTVTYTLAEDEATLDVLTGASPSQPEVATPGASGD